MIGDVRHGGLEEEPQPEMYINYLQGDAPERLIRGRCHFGEEDHRSARKSKPSFVDYLAAQLRAQRRRQRESVRTLAPENLRNLILAVCEFLARVHSDCAQPHQQFESLVEGNIKKILFELLSHWLRQTNPNLSTEMPATVATWAIYGLASLYSHNKRRPALETFADEVLPLVAVNLEQFA